MSEAYAIEFRGVSKYFPAENVLGHGLKHLLLHLPLTVRRMVRPNRIRVLDNVSFNIAKGESVALIGKNGAGKSATLGLIAGVLQPNSGSIRVSSHVCPLLELGAGFRSELSGAENIFLNGVLLGVTRREIRERFQDIVEFSGLKEFLEQPLRTYSTGMVARLGFAVAVHLEPEILLVDEILSVGDANFAEKCRERMLEFRRKRVTIVLVSHSSEAVKALCDRAIWLHDNRVAADGNASDVWTQYEEEMRRPRSDVVNRHPSVLE